MVETNNRDSSQRGNRHAATSAQLVKNGRVVHQHLLRHEFVQVHCRGRSVEGAKSPQDGSRVPRCSASSWRGSLSGNGTAGNVEIVDAKRRGVAIDNAAVLRLGHPGGAHRCARFADTSISLSASENGSSLNRPPLSSPSTSWCEFVSSVVSVRPAGPLPTMQRLDLNTSPRGNCSTSEIFKCLSLLFFLQIAKRVYAMTGLCCGSCRLGARSISGWFSSAPFSSSSW